MFQASATHQLDTSQFKVQPFKHQLDGIKQLVEKEAFALFDEMGVGKSKQVVDSACLLESHGVIDTVLVVCPAGVRSVWLDAELGQIERSAWRPSWVQEFSARNLRLKFAPGLNWVITSYEFIRQEHRRDELQRQLRGRQVMMVCDESSAIKNHKAKQTRACWQIADCVAKRRVILNGTPIANNPLDLYAQFRFLGVGLTRFANFYHFRARFAKMGGYLGKQVVGFYDLDEMNKLLEPHLLRRVKSDCLDLPPKLPTQIEVPLETESWRVYKEMREDLVAYLGAEACVANVAAIKALRLSQITSGFLGGVVRAELPEAGIGNDHALIDFDHVTPGEARVDRVANRPEPYVREIGDEKVRAIVEWLGEHGDEVKRVLIWCRFRKEIERFAERLEAAGWFAFKLYGGQTRQEREEVVREGEIGTKPLVAIIGQPQAGGMGLTLTSINHVIYASNDYNLKTRLQSEDRCHRPGQLHPVTYLDVLATGPDGQKTIDHAIVKALRKKLDVATWTTQEWRKALEEAL